MNEVPSAIDAPPKAVVWYVDELAGPREVIPFCSAKPENGINYRELPSISSDIHRVPISADYRPFA
jgi:hypothetical protein